MIVMLLLVAADDIRFALPAADRLWPACVSDSCAASPPGDRYRIERSGSSRVSAKDRAFAADGSYCSVVGARQCTRKPRTVLTAPLGN